MTSLELARKLLEYPEFEVRVLEKGTYFGDPCTFFEHLTEEMFDVDTLKKIIYLGRD